MTRRGVIVVGGGVAGLAAAIELAGRGVRVTLLESRRRLGGRAGSFHDKATGETLDNCQHVALGCCTSYLELLQRLGSLQRLVWTDRQYWIMRGGREHVLAPDPLPSPLHLTRGLCSAPFLSLRAKAAVVRAIADAAMEPAPSAGSFADWLRERQQPIDAVRHFWWPLMVSACNLSPAHLAAGPALQVIREGLLLSRTASSVGLSAGSLDDLYAEAPARLAAVGAEVRFGAHAETIEPRRVTLRSGESLEARAVVLATPFEHARRPLEANHDPRAERVAQLCHSPILGVHLAFDRPVLHRPHAVLVGSSTHWLFRKSIDGRRVHAVMSASRGRAALAPEEVVRRVCRDVAAWLPHARDARLVWSRVVKERRATFAATPEGERARPPIVGTNGMDGLLLAGDYVQTGWPATMEGAARAGFAAAAAVLGVPASEVVPPPMAPGVISAAMGLSAVGAEGVERR